MGTRANGVHTRSVQVSAGCGFDMAVEPCDVRLSHNSKTRITWQDALAKSSALSDWIEGCRGGTCDSQSDGPDAMAPEQAVS